MKRQQTLWDAERKTLDDSLEITAQSLNAYASNYDHWALAYSGGKDSSALLAAVIHLIRTGKCAAPKSLTVLRSDTRMELPPLDITARKIMAEVRAAGFNAYDVLPAMDDRFFVYMLGRGVPPLHGFGFIESCRAIFRRYRSALNLAAATGAYGNSCHRATNANALRLNLQNGWSNAPANPQPQDRVD